MTESNDLSRIADSPCAGPAGAVTVEMTGGGHLARRLAPLFSGGVGVDVVSGCTLRALLNRQLDIDNDYVEGRLQTVFLNGKPVDDIDAARVRAGDVLALSAAMPGLVGATMRRGGRYAVLRQDITHTGDADCSQNPQPICLTLKLFNLIAAELAPALFARGVWLDGDRMADHMALIGDALWNAVTAVSVDGMSVAPEELIQSVRGRAVHLRARLH